jgi:hypothetical protein
MSDLEHIRNVLLSVSFTRERLLSMELSFLRISDPALNRDWRIAGQMGEIELLFIDLDQSASRFSS